MVGALSMIELSPISNALSSLRTAKDLLEHLPGLSDTAFLSKLIELRSKLTDAESAAFADQDERVGLLQRMHLLEKEVTDLKAWKTEKERCELQEVASRGGARSSEPSQIKSDHFPLTAAKPARLSSDQ
jgi:hypothetical protein